MAATVMEQGRRDGWVCLSVLQSWVTVCLHCGQELLCSDTTLDRYMCFTLSSTFMSLVTQVIHDCKPYASSNIIENTKILLTHI